MICTTCHGKYQESSKCVLKAIDTLKDHFLMMQSLCVDNGNLIDLLKQRNEKLYKAVDLLKQQKEQCLKSSPKRRRSSPKIMSRQKLQECSNSLPQTDSPKMPESQSSLNMNIALQHDEEDEETITETEPPISPYKPWTSRRKVYRLNCENKRPESTTKTDKKNEWLSKLPKEELPLGKTKMSLTLRGKSSKMKQTRLKFDGSRNKNESGDKDVIESSPNLYTALKEAQQSRTLLQRNETISALDVNSSSASTSMKKNNSEKNKHPVFDMNDDDSFFDLCPDPTVKKSPTGLLPSLSGCSNTSSVVMLTPATQEIVFLDDSIEEVNAPLNTMDFMAEAIKEDDKVSMTRLQEYEAKLIKEQQQAAAKAKSTPTITKVKVEQLTEQAEDNGNESTKLPDDFEMEEEEVEEEEEPFPLPIVIKQEKEQTHEPTLKEKYNIECAQCLKFVNFMGSSMTDLQISEYLLNCRHFDQRDLDNNTPEGFWNPLLVSFAEDDPRRKVHVDHRLANRKK